MCGHRFTLKTRFAATFSTAKPVFPCVLRRGVISVESRTTLSRKKPAPSAPSSIHSEPRKRPADNTRGNTTSNRTRRQKQKQKTKTVVPISTPFPQSANVTPFTPLTTLPSTFNYVDVGGGGERGTTVTKPFSSPSSDRTTTDRNARPAREVSRNEQKETRRNPALQIAPYCLVARQKEHCPGWPLACQRSPWVTRCTAPTSFVVSPHGSMPPAAGEGNAPFPLPRVIKLSPHASASAQCFFALFSFARSLRTTRRGAAGKQSKHNRVSPPAEE